MLAACVILGSAVQIALLKSARLVPMFLWVTVMRRVAIARVAVSVITRLVSANASLVISVLSASIRPSLETFDLELKLVIYKILIFALAEAMRASEIQLVGQIEALSLNSSFFSCHKVWINIEIEAVGLPGRVMRDK